MEQPFGGLQELEEVGIGPPARGLGILVSRVADEKAEIIGFLHFSLQLFVAPDQASCTSDANLVQEPLQYAFNILFASIYSWLTTLIVESI